MQGFTKKKTAGIAPVVRTGILNARSFTRVICRLVSAAIPGCGFRSALWDEFEKRQQNTPPRSLRPPVGSLAPSKATGVARALAALQDKTMRGKLIKIGCHSYVRLFCCCCCHKSIPSLSEFVCVICYVTDVAVQGTGKEIRVGASTNTNSRHPRRRGKATRKTTKPLDATI